MDRESRKPSTLTCSGSQTHQTHCLRTFVWEQLSGLSKRPLVVLSSQLKCTASEGLPSHSLTHLLPTRPGPAWFPRVSLPSAPTYFLHNSNHSLKGSHFLFKSLRIRLPKLEYKIFEGQNNCLSCSLLHPLYPEPVLAHSRCFYIYIYTFEFRTPGKSKSNGKFTIDITFGARNEHC